MFTQKIDKELIENVMKELRPVTQQTHFEEMINIIDRIIEQTNIRNTGKKFRDKEKIDPLYNKLKLLYQMILDCKQYEDENITEITQCKRIIHIKTPIPTYYYSKIHRIPFINISGIYVPVAVYIIPYDLNKYKWLEHRLESKDEKKVDSELKYGLSSIFIDGELRGKAEYLNVIDHRLAVAIDKSSWITEFFTSPKNYEYLNVC